MPSITVPDRKGKFLYGIPLVDEAEPAGPGIWHGNFVSFIGQSKDLVSLFVADLSAHGIRVISLDGKVEPTEVALASVAVSPDGKQVALPIYSRSRWGNIEDTRLVLIDLEPVKTIPIVSKESTAPSTGRGAGQ